MDRQHRHLAFRRLAGDLDGVDLAVYREHGADPLEPIIGEGDARARLAVFGRDPGREEVRYRRPFIGAGGQKVRGVVYEVVHGRAMPDFEASVKVGDYLFWANTVPYKPIGNKAWSTTVKKRFQPLMADVLLTEWHGSDVVTLGREAFLWFGLAQDREVRQSLDDHWRREDRFEASLTIDYCGPGKNGRPFRLHPLPHPSPLNATWYRRFPDLLRARLRSLGLTPETWQIPSGKG